MQTVFVDTWAWVALALRRDQHHAAAKRIHQRLVAIGTRYCSTDYVLAETITNLYSVLSPELAEKYVGAILHAVEANQYRLECISQDRFQEAWKLRCQFSDKPSVSFTDFTSFVVMRELSIQDVFSGDKHFSQVNMGFRLVDA